MTQEFRKLPRGRVFFWRGGAYIKTSYRRDKDCYNAEHLASQKVLQFSPGILVAPH